MELKSKDILKLAELVRLSLSESEVKRLEHDIDAVLHYVAKITELKAQRVSPGIGEDNVLREDAVLHRFNIDEPFTHDRQTPEDLLIVPPVFKK